MKPVTTRLVCPACGCAMTSRLRCKTCGTTSVNPTKSAVRVSISPKGKTVTIGRWIHIYDSKGNEIRKIMRPTGKTRIPLAQIRENVHRVIAERLAREAAKEE